MQIKKSSWKYPFNFFNYKKKDNLKVFDRNITLTSKFLDKIVYCYKGKVIGKLLVTKQHIGHKLGEFFLTKILGERVAYRKKLKALMKKKKNKLKRK